MDKKLWKNKIKNAAKKAGTYQPFFDSVIDTLADILARRDDALNVFEKTGGNCVITHTNKGGNQYIEQNPILRLANDLNRDALAYWRDLGLTPAGLKKINEAAMQKKEEGSALEKALLKLGGGA